MEHLCQVISKYNKPFKKLDGGGKILPPPPSARDPKYPPYNRVND